MKGIAILLVMVCHAAGRFFEGRVRYFTPFGGIGVSIFLILSAYGLNESHQRSGLSKWWSKRLLAVFLPYLIIQCLCYWPFHAWNGVGFVLDVSLLKPLYINGWYLNYLLVCYACFYIVMCIPVLNRHKVMAFWLFSIISFSFLEPIRAEQSLSFLTGVILSEYKDSRWLKKLESWKSGLILVIIGVVFLAIKQSPIIRSSPQMIYNFVELMIKLPCGLGICLIAISLSRIVNLKAVSFVGVLSYELYLVHGYVLEWVPISIAGMFLFWVGSFCAAVILHYLVGVIHRVVQKSLIMG